MDAATLADLRTPGSVLILAPAGNSGSAEVCFDLLAGDLNQLRVFVITYVRTPAEWLEAWRRRFDGLPAEFVFLTPVEPEEALPDDVLVESIGSPADLTGQGIRLGTHLERWAEMDGDIAVCLDSLTTLLQYTEAHDVYRFIHLMSTRFNALGVRAHIHLDPATADETTIASLTSAVKGLARHTEGGWEANVR